MRTMRFQIQMPIPSLSGKTLLSAAFCLLLFLSLPTVGRSQVTTGDLLGTITDSAGAVVQNASVTVTNLETHETRQTQSNAAGEYEVTLLPAGHYSVTVSSASFKKVEQSDIALSAGDRRRTNVTLTLGEAAQTVEVSTAPPSLDTDTSSLSTVVTEAQVQELPLNGRDFVQLAQLAAGANEGTPAALSNGNRSADRRQTSAVVANGQSDALNQEFVDGLDNNEGTIGTLGVRPSLDAIAEFRVITNLYPAEAGKTPGAYINIVTKSGTDKLHGSAYEFIRNNAVDARNFFARTGPAPEYRQNQFGGSVGGPIIHDRTFFFGDYEGLRIVQGTTISNVVPTLFEEQHPGNLTDVGGPIIASPNPISLQYLALYPAPNVGTNTYVASPNIVQNSNLFDVRVDHSFNSSNMIFGRYSFNKVTTIIPGAFPAVNGVEGGGSATSPGSANQPAQQALADFTHIFSPTLALELKAGYLRVTNQSLPLNYGLNAGLKFGIANSNFNLFTSALPNVSINGLAPLGDSGYLPIVWITNAFQYSASLSQTKGNHSLKYGVILIRRQIENQQNASGSGTYSFNPLTGVLALTNFFNGNVAAVSRQAQLEPFYFREWEPSLYAQDDWRATRALTLNLGLRYDIITPVTDAHGQLSNFDPATLSLIIPGVNGGSDTAGINTDYRSLAPRFGFAYTPRLNTVVRGGFGLVFFRDNTGPSLPFGNPPFVTSYAPPSYTTNFSTPLPLPVAGSTTNLNGQLLGMNLNYKNSYIEQMNLNIEQALGGVVITVGYVGELGRHLRITPDLDLAPPNAAGGANPALIQAHRPYYAELPAVTSLPQVISQGFSNYQGLQVTAVRRLSKGLTGQASYTYSHDISDTVGYSQGGLYSSVDPLHTAQRETGNSDFDLRHRFTLMLNYALPFGQSATGYKKTLIGGWQFNAIDVWETGFPFSAINSVTVSGTGGSNERPNQLHNPNNIHHSISEWFDTTAFQGQAFGTIGSAGRDTIYGPSYRHFDASIFKDFALTERLKLQARIESFNLTNTPNFAAPGATLGTPTYGVVTSTRTGSTPRQLQAALRLTF
jgi:hypothetical protein